jgi:6-phosphofructokinase 1
LDNIANEERTIPLEWISDGGTNVSQEMIDYLRPLVRGDSSETIVGGLPRFFRFDWTKIVGPAE